MARNIEVTPEQLENAASKIESLAADYQTQYKLLYSETDAMASGWQGRDNVAYITKIGEFKNDFEAMYKLMNDYADFLRKSAKAYRDTQQGVVDATKNLRS